MISSSALAGYLLEEAIAKLLQSSGYHLLTRAADDPDALRDGKHGLLVRGRGANHQADALGQLHLPTPFTYPLRLFTEAKFRGSRTGLADVRNALGVVNDVNERHRSRSSPRGRLPEARYQYRYSLFSASGFTGPAQSFALAQQISLVDLQGPAFEDILDATRTASRDLRALAVRSGLSSFPTGQVRTLIRQALGTWVDDDEDGVSILGAEVDLLDPTRVQVVARDFAHAISGELVLAFPTAPFILALRPINGAAFESFLAEGDQVQEINISFTAAPGSVGEWRLYSAEDPGTALAYFGLPPLVEAWLLSEGDDEISRRARQLKQEILSTLTIFRGKRTHQLEYRPFVRQSRTTSDFVSEVDSLLRVAHTSIDHSPPVLTSSAATDARPSAADLNGGPESTFWTLEAVRLLLDALDDEAPVRAAVMRLAALQGGVVFRSEIYELGQYAETRTLRGFTTPVRRITDRLKDEGRLAIQAAYPLRPWYPKPGPATLFLVPTRICELIRDQP